MARKKKQSGAAAKPPSIAGWAFLVGLVIFLLYLPSLWSDFVYDAQSQILADPYIHTRSHFWDVLTFRVLSQDVLDGNRPIQLLFLMLDSLAWGKNPLGYHLTSDLFHALNAALLFVLSVRLLSVESSGGITWKTLWIASLGALFFGVHPVNTEAIAEVSCREDPLATCFLLLGLNLAIRFPGANPRQTVWLGGACIASLLFAAGAKETGYIGPLLIGLYWLLYRRREPIKPWISLLAAAAAVVGAFIIARFALQPEVSQIFRERPRYLGGTFSTAIMTEPRLWAHLVLSALWPARLSADYMPQDLGGITISRALFGLGLFLVFQAFLSWKSRLALLGSVIFWLGLAPVSNFIPLYRVLADRFLYLPMAGFALILCAGLSLVQMRRGPFFTLSILWAAATLTLVPLAWQRQHVFSTSLNLWSDTIAKSPTSDTAADNLGYACYEAARYQEALDAFQRAINLTNGKMADAWAGAALTLEKVGESQRADKALSRAIEVDAAYAYPQKLLEALVVNQTNADRLEIIARRVRDSTPPPAK